MLCFHECLLLSNDEMTKELSRRKKKKKSLYPKKRKVQRSDFARIPWLE